MFAFLQCLLNIFRKFEFLISQGSVTTCLRCGGYCCVGSVANFIRFTAVQKFWKSVKIWQSCREFKGGNFFETQCSRPMPVWLWPCCIVHSNSRRQPVVIQQWVLMHDAPTQGARTAAKAGDGDVHDPLVSIRPLLCIQELKGLGSSGPKRTKVPKFQH